MESNYRDWLQLQIGGQREPHDYQLRVAERIWARQNVIVEAPTGAGKTLAVLGPYLFDRRRTGARRLIYCLPLRSLAAGIYREAKRVADAAVTVTLQTGEQPDDPFFSVGDIIVTTYDQLVSSLLCASYAQTPRNQNVNAAAALGNLVVFDEFHLMETSLAFLTAAECLRFFGESARTIWMSATATSPLADYLKNRLGAQPEGFTESEENAFLQKLGIEREIILENHGLTSQDILRAADHNTLVVVNQVGRAQTLYQEAVAGLGPERVRLLHARFFQRDREDAESWINDHFGTKRTSPAPVVAIATQVIEAGLDLSCEQLLTDLCPMNALVQRAGRCARFQDQKGTVRVFPLNGASLHPYEKEVLERTLRALPSQSSMTPGICRKWVETVHQEQDKNDLRKSSQRSSECREVISGRFQRIQNGRVSHLIRHDSDTVRLMIRNNPHDLLPSRIESITVYRDRLRKHLHKSPVAWVFDPTADTWWRQISTVNEIESAFAVCLPPTSAGYSKREGLNLGGYGAVESPDRPPTAQPAFGSLREELWTDHADAVRVRALQMWDEIWDPSALIARLAEAERLRPVIEHTALLHDLGKLQETWQQWARKYQALVTSDDVPKEAMAHTRFNADNPNHRAAQRQAGKRPAHACAGAYYTWKSLGKPAPDDRNLWLAMVSAIAAHHGAWVKNPGIIADLISATPQQLEKIGVSFRTEPPPSQRDLFKLGETLSLTETFAERWPTTACLVRILRLADRLATQEASTDE